MYDVEFQFEGNYSTFLDRLIDWYMARRRDCLGAATSLGNGFATVENIYEVFELERDLGVSVIAVKKIEEEELEPA